MKKVQWQSPPDDLTLRPHETHVWLGSFSKGIDHLQALFSTLSGDERIRAERLGDSELRAHFIIGRGWLRSILARYLRIPAEAIQFCYGPQGKPALDDNLHSSSIHFNLAHSGDKALFGITQLSEIGVDIEWMKAFPGIDDIALRYFSTREYSEYSQLPAGMKLRGFYNCWTRKEACLKALGAGLAYPLDKFEVSLRPGQPAKILRMEDDLTATGQWALFDVPIHKDYAATLAIDACETTLYYWQC